MSLKKDRTYQGPGSIPMKLADALIEALNPILDILAEDKPLPVKFQTDPLPRKVEENRWVLWRAVMIAHEAVCYQGGNDIWSSSPIRRRHALMLTGEPWYRIRCGRPTKKGKPCQAPLRFGRAHCWRHSTVEETLQLRTWQNDIHLPYPRARIHARPFDIAEVRRGLAELLEEMV